MLANVRVAFTQWLSLPKLRTIQPLAGAPSAALYLSEYTLGAADLALPPLAPEAVGENFLLVVALPGAGTHCRLLDQRHRLAPGTFLWLRQGVPVHLRAEAAPTSSVLGWCFTTAALPAELADLLLALPLTQNPLVPVRPLTPPDRAQPAAIVTAGRGMTDSDFPSVAILSSASLADLSARMGMDLSPDRFRGNLWLDGAAPWTEFEWIGQSIRIGGAVLQIKERITRCNATKVDPATGVPNADTLGALEAAFGHQDFGVYAVVTTSGPITVGDEWRLV